jgi:eukaryotic-like serine/threonine-protein kinase
VSISKFRPLASLGRGGMADVILAQQNAGGASKLVVLKRIRENLVDEEEYREMFMDEARLASNLNHPNIVQTFDVGQDERGPYFVMEFMEGQALSRVIRVAAKNGTPLSLAIGVTVIEQALSALHYAHELVDHDGQELNIVHRDVSPQNIFVTYGGIAKLLDFGVAKSATALVETRAGVLKGKVAYMSPEQMLQGKTVDRRGDVFSAGVILWELMAQRRFWDGAADMDVLQALKTGLPRPSPKTIREDLPQELVDVCMKAIHPDKEERYATAQAFLLALEAVREKLGMRATQSEIAALMKSLFLAQQVEMRKAIEARVQSRVTVDASEASSLSALQALSGSGVSASNERSQRVGFAEGTPAPASSIAATRLLANKWVIAGVAALLLTPIGVLAVRATAPVPPTSSAEATATAPQTVSMPSFQARSQQVKVQIAVTPADAKLFIDGKPVSNPYFDLHAMDTKLHEVHAEARNHESRTLQRAFAADTELQLALAWKGGERAWPSSTGVPAKASGTTKVTVQAPVGGGITELTARPKATAAPIENPF